MASTFRVKGYCCCVIESIPGIKNRGADPDVAWTADDLRKMAMSREAAARLADRSGIDSSDRLVWGRMGRPRRVGPVVTRRSGGSHQMRRRMEPPWGLGRDLRPIRFPFSTMGGRQLVPGTAPFTSGENFREGSRERQRRRSPRSRWGYATPHHRAHLSHPPTVFGRSSVPLRTSRTM